MKKIIISIILIILFLLIFTGYKNSCNIKAKRLYSQGYEFYKEQKYSDAYFNFKKISPLSKLYRVSLVKQYFCAIKLNDKKTAYQKLKKLVRISKDDVIAPWAMYQEALLAIDLGLDSDKKSFKKFENIYKKFPQNDYGLASAYKACVLSDDEEFQISGLIDYLKNAPIGKFSSDAINILLKTNILSKDDYEVIANSYFLNQKYSEALKYYLKTDFSNNWYNIAKCYKNLANKDEELKTIENGLKLIKSDIKEEDIELALNRLVVLKNVNKLDLLQTLYDQYASSYIHPTVTYELAETSNSVRSSALYEQVVKNYPDSIWASNSLWEMFWYNYKLQRYPVCIDLAKLHTQKYSKAMDAPRVLYWQGRALLNERKKQAARDVFYKVIRKYPLSYYAFLSVKQLKSSQNNKIIVKKPIISYDINLIHKHIFENDDVLFFANNDDFETIEELKINDEYIKSMVLRKKGFISSSIKTAKDKYLEQKQQPYFKDKELKLIYPVMYEDEINKYAAKYNQSPYLFMSLIKEESHFDENAKSSVGAIGLTQLMPSTADFIKKRPVNSDELANSEKNIEMGLQYFSYLVDLFDKNVYFAILAYNAGPGNVKKWLNDPFIANGDIDIFVENIPYLETKNYIKKILSTYWIYLNIYCAKNI